MSYAIGDKTDVNVYDGIIKPLTEWAKSLKTDVGCDDVASKTETHMWKAFVKGYTSTQNAQTVQHTIAICSLLIYIFRNYGGRDNKINITNCNAIQ